MIEEEGGRSKVESETGQRITFVFPKAIKVLSVDLKGREWKQLKWERLQQTKLKSLLKWMQRKKDNLGLTNNPVKSVPSELHLSLQTIDMGRLLCQTNKECVRRRVKVSTWCHFQGQGEVKIPGVN